MGTEYWGDMILALISWISNTFSIAGDGSSNMQAMLMAWRRARNYNELIV
jgi:hypothetical protein